MSVLLAFDTATPATVVGLDAGSGDVIELRHDPAPGERPGHAAQLLPLCRDALVAAGLDWPDVDRIGAGIGPGTFTGLRIGVATARALGQASGAELVAVSTLEALALGAQEADDPAKPRAGRPPSILTVLDARRGEAFVAAWAGRERLLEPAAVKPEQLAGLADPARGPWLAVGDGSVRFRDQLEPAGITVPADGSPLHRVGARALCRLTREGRPTDREALLPEYVRAPDAEPRRRGTAT
jgi:tRNA threonylcarbamoyladenosine biosynthesis protein TsaB